MSGQWTEWERSKFLEGLPDMSSGDSRPGHNLATIAAASSGIAGKAVCAGQRQCTQLDSARKKCPQAEGHLLRLSGRHAKLRREGYRKR